MRWGVVLDLIGHVLGPLRETQSPRLGRFTTLFLLYDKLRQLSDIQALPESGLGCGPQLVFSIAGLEGGLKLFPRSPWSLPDMKVRQSTPLGTHDIGRNSSRVGNNEAHRLIVEGCVTKLSVPIR